MKTLINRILYSIFFFCIISCANDSIEESYYKNGAVKQRIIKVNEYDYEVTNFYKNGVKESHGLLRDSIRVGIWQEHYLSGELRWEGEYPIDFNRILNYNENPIRILSEEKKLKIDSTYTVKIQLPKELLRYSYLQSNIAEIFPSSEKNEYDFVIKPQTSGDLIIELFVPYDLEVYKVSSVKINVDK